MTKLVVAFRNFPKAPKNEWDFKYCTPRRIFCGLRVKLVGFNTIIRLRAGRPRNRGSISGRGKIFFCTPPRQHRLCSPTERPSQCVPPSKPAGTGS